MQADSSERSKMEASFKNIFTSIFSAAGDNSEKIIISGGKISISI